MQRYRFVIEYLGTKYSGWQRQLDRPNVQGTLEDAFEICLKAEIKVVASGRTDTGVHAEGQVAHFDCDVEFEIDKIQRSINHLTPDDLFIRNFQKCSKDFHARYSALFREYRYTIIFRPSAIHYARTWYCPYTLDQDYFKSELKDTLGRHDFLGFSIPRMDGKSTDCIIYKAELEAREYRFQIILRGNRFLHKMARSIVGACYDVSRKKHAPGLTKSILQMNCRVERTWAPGIGLCLTKVGYKDYEY